MEDRCLSWHIFPIPCKWFDSSMNLRASPSGLRTQGVVGSMPGSPLALSLGYVGVDSAQLQYAAVAQPPPFSGRHVIFAKDA